MKNTTHRLLFLVLLVPLFIGCGPSRSHNGVELEPGNYLYDNAHIFAQSYDGDTLIELHLYNDSSGHYRPYGGPDALMITRGNDTEGYSLRLVETAPDENAYSILDDAGNSVGTISIRPEWYDGRLGIITLHLENLVKDVIFHRILLISGQEALIPRENDSTALFLISALDKVDVYDSDWPVAAKNLALFLHRDLVSGNRPDYSILPEHWEIATSSDNKLTSFMVDYYNGGNGAGSFEQREILQYWSGKTNHVIEDFDAWIWEDESHIHNFPILCGHRILTWENEKDPVYLFDYSFIDDKPMMFDDGQHAKEYFSILGAFKISNGSIVPAKVFQAKDSLFSSIAVENAWGEVFFKLDTDKGILGVPLIEKDDYRHHGDYILYEWNPGSGLFEYHGKKERL